MPSAVLLTRDIRHLEEGAAGASPPLMERAGAAAAALAARIAGDSGKDILLLAGPGNNGGDARVAARILKEKFFRVSLVSRAADIPADTRWSLIVDGLFGLGLSRPIEGENAKLVDYANAQACPVLALDIPSGINADTGRAYGRAIKATHTITFLGLKPGLLMLDGPDHCGQVTVADLGIEAPSGTRATGWVADPAMFGNVLQPRPRKFHKGMAGSLGILGGAPGMTGAALLAGRAAQKLGAGRVYVGTLAGLDIDPVCPELMLRKGDDVLGLDLDAIVVGPGLGQSGHAETLLGAVLTSELPCVLDADALNLLAGNPDLRDACNRRVPDTILTPHPAEAGRLIGFDAQEVQADRLSAARRIAGELKAHVVLKGNGSVLVARDGHWFVNTSGNSGMASAGMGDVLSGILGALLAQQYSGESALVLGTHLHGLAADDCVRDGGGPVGLTAGEIIEPARRLWNRWLAGAPA